MQLQIAPNSNKVPVSRKFKELPIPAFFLMDEKIYCKLSATKIRSYGESKTKILRKNPDVTYYGQDMSDVLPHVDIA